MDLPISNVLKVSADLMNSGFVTNELKPCPFCGDEKILTAATENERTKNIVYKAWCTNMDCTAMIHVCIGKIDTIDKSRSELVSKWNTRQTPDI
jgi:Lar family restriction alleviation protein